MYDCKFFNQNKVKKNSPFVNGGFTILELLIVIVTMTLLFGAGYANYREFQKREHLEGAARMIRGDLRLAQEMALAGRKPTEPAGNPCETNDLGGYVFVRSSAYSAGPPKVAASYEIYAVCPSWGTNRVLVKGPVELPEDVDLLSFGSNRFTFLVLGKGTDLVSNLDLRVQFVGTGMANRTITITTQGSIN